METAKIGTSKVALDLIERFALLVLLGYFLVRLVPSLTAEPYNLLLLASEAFTVLLVLLRKPGAMADTSYAWTIAIVGTAAPLFVAALGQPLIPIWLGTLLMSAGLALSLSAKVFLNRSFGIVAANRGVKRRGPYRLIRHPMYAGYFITHIGFLLLHFGVWNVLVYAIGWIGLILRIRAEEEFLLQDEAYRFYSADVRYRLIPGLF
jgi:protein-S-isoprenylcysteine O-methyltransferase Ste14